MRNLILNFVNLTKKEIFGIFWPSYKETFLITLIVFFISLIISILLWLIDNSLLRLVSLFMLIKV
ncbi:MAG: preprotein translocase subunit SecE [Enterobacteriaceae bacterium]